MPLLPVDGRGSKRVVVMATKKAVLYARNLSKTSERGSKGGFVRAERTLWNFQDGSVNGRRIKESNPHPRQKTPYVGMGRNGTLLIGAHNHCKLRSVFTGCW